MVGLSLPGTWHPLHAVAAVGSWVELDADVVRRVRTSCVCRGERIISPRPAEPTPSARIFTSGTQSGIEMPPAPRPNGDTQAYGQVGRQRRTGDA